MLLDTSCLGQNTGLEVMKPVWGGTIYCHREKSMPGHFCQGCVEGGRKPVGRTQLEPCFGHIKRLRVLLLSLGCDAGSLDEGSNTTTICY